MLQDRRLMLCGLAAAAFAAPCAALAQQTPSPADGDAGDGVSPDEAAAEVATGRDAALRMVAPVMINGAGPFNFMVDTGANRSCVSRELAERLALPAGPQAAVSTVAGRSLRPTVHVDRLHVGPREQRKVNVPSLKLVGEEAMDGILGVDWLKGRKLVLDFKGRMLSITPPRRESDAPNRVVVPARRRSGQLTMVDADVDGQQISAMIDSGSELTIGNPALRRLVSRSNHGFVGPQSKVTLVTVVGETFQGDMAYLPFMRLGGLNLGNVPVVFADSHVFDMWGLKSKPALVLGMDLLSEFTAVALDFGLSTVRFDIA